MSFFEHIFGGIPGGHFSHGGMPGHDDSDDDEPVDTEKYYNILGVEKNASQSELKKAYRKKCMKLHPDRHPDEKEKYLALFQDLQTAYDTLKDEHKRKLYDKYGEKGVKRGGGRSKSDLMRQFFGHRDDDESGPRKSPPIKRQLLVTLEDLFRGNLKKINIMRKVGQEGSAACDKCKGQGEITMMQRMGPVMFQQRRACPKCEGNGYMLTEEAAEVEFHVPIGAKNGETITVPGEGHKYPKHLQGDIVILLRMKKHEIFTRQGADLGMTHELTLREALCGYKLRVEHVSGSTLVITPKEEGEIVQPGDLKCVFTQGMPQRYATHIRGNLFIVMEVKLPLAKSIKSNHFKQLKSILPNTETNVELFADNDEKDKDKEEKEQQQQQQPKEQLKGFFNKPKKSKKKSKKKKQKKQKEEIIEVEAEQVEGRPTATPASARGMEDEDRDGGVQCHQM